MKVRLLLQALYWLAVLLISLALLVALVLFFEARDESALEGPRSDYPRLGPTTAGPLLTNRANTM